METALNFDKVWQIFQETGRRFQEMPQEMARLSKETDRQFTRRRIVSSKRRTRS